MKKKRLSIIMKGQALITLLFFIVIASTVTAASVVIIMTDSSAATKMQEGTRAYYVAESGVENALLRLLRDPSYTGETLPVSDGSVTITVSGTGPYTILAVGTVGNFQRTIQVNASYTNNILSVTSWQEQ